MVNWIVVATGPFWFILVISALAIGAAAILNFAWLAILIDCTPIQHRNIVISKLCRGVIAGHYYHELARTGSLQGHRDSWGILLCSRHLNPLSSHLIRVKSGALP